MGQRVWQKWVAGFLLLCAIPIACHKAGQVRFGANPIPVSFTAASGGAHDFDCSCQDNCFCCSHMIPTRHFELSAVLRSAPAPVDQLANEPEDRAVALYHPPRA